MSHTCDPIRTDLGAYVLGGLEEHEAREVERHVLECERCRAELHELEPVPGLLEAASRHTPLAPEHLRERVLAAARPPRRPSWLVAAAAAVVALLVGVGGMAILDREAPPDTVVELEPVAAAPMDGEARLREVDSGVRVELEVGGVRPAADGYYHVWLHRDGNRVSAGTFVGDGGARVRAELQCGGRLADYDRITVEWYDARSHDERTALEGALRT